MPSFRHLKKGDKVTRMLAGKLPMPMLVMEVSENRIFCVAENAGQEHWEAEEMWQFDRDTGVEEDHDLGWGVQFGQTGSFLTENH